MDFSISQSGRIFHSNQLGLKLSTWEKLLTADELLGLGDQKQACFLLVTPIYLEIHNICRLLRAQGSIFFPFIPLHVPQLTSTSRCSVISSPGWISIWEVRNREHQAVDRLWGFRPVSWTKVSPWYFHKIWELHLHTRHNQSQHDNQSHLDSIFSTRTLVLYFPAVSIEIN